MISQLESYLRSCSYCGRSFGFSDILCEPCWAKVLKANPAQKILAPIQIPVTARFLWIKSGDARVEQIVRVLKKARFLEAYIRLAQELCYLRSDVNNACFIPMPPSIEGNQDHAFLLATGLGKVTGLPVYPILRWKFKGSSQKLKSRTERMKVKMQLNCATPPNLRIILVDDVVTTGATALAAYEALGTPNLVELWTVACRPKHILL